MNRQARTQMAEETLAILNTGTYAAPGGQRVDVSARLRASVQETQVIRPNDWPSLIEQARASCPTRSPAAIEVTSETTLAAARRLVLDEHRERVAALNFASAKNPGGGFLSGSQAQEESLARSSGLYASLQAAPDYYQANRKCSSLLYTDHAIFSPDVPVFRHDDGTLLGQPYTLSFITMPAANVGAIRSGSPDLPRVEHVMEHRMNCVFALAARMGQRSLILGAWGCGVFRNDPDLIASLFARCLSGDGSWRSCFDRIVFAVYDTTPGGTNRLPFDRHLARPMQ